MSANVWPDGIDVGRRGEGPEFESGRTFFSSLIFFFFLFFFVKISSQLLQFCFVSLYSLKFFRFINFLLYCLILPSPRSPSQGPAIYVLLVHFKSSVHELRQIKHAPEKKTLYHIQQCLININQGYLPESANEANLFIFFRMCLLVLRDLLHSFRKFKIDFAQKRMANKFHPSLKQHLWHILGFHFYQTITTWLEALLVNWSKSALMFQGKFHCIKTIKVRK